MSQAKAGKRIKHTVTPAQSQRIGIPAGTVIECEMYTKEEIATDPIRKNIAKSYYLGGVRRGGTLLLTD